MKELRRVDDNIINRLNSSLSQADADGVCSDFFKQMSEAYYKRDEAIDYCLKVIKKVLCKWVVFNCMRVVDG